MDKTKLLIGVLFLLLFIPSVKADLPNNTFTVDESVNVNVYCIMLNNSKCDNSSTTCEITAFYPNSSYLVQNGGMQGNASGFFNYSFGNLSIPGTYPALVHCKNTEEGVVSFDFTVGIFEAIESNWVLAIMLALSGTAFIFIFMFKNFNEIHIALKLLFLMTGIIILVICANVALQFVSSTSGYLLDSSVVTALTTITSRFYQVLVIILYFTSFYFIIMFLSEVFTFFANIRKR